MMILLVSIGSSDHRRHRYRHRHRRSHDRSIMVAIEVFECVRPLRVQGHHHHYHHYYHSMVLAWWSLSWFQECGDDWRMPSRRAILRMVSPLWWLLWLSLMIGPSKDAMDDDSESADSVFESTPEWRVIYYCGYDSDDDDDDVDDVVAVERYWWSSSFC